MCVILVNCNFVSKETSVKIHIEIVPAVVIVVVVVVAACYGSTLFSVRICQYIDAFHACAWNIKEWGNAVSCAWRRWNNNNNNNNSHLYYNNKKAERLVTPEQTYFFWYKYTVCTVHVRLCSMFCHQCNNILGACGMGSIYYVRFDIYILHTHIHTYARTVLYSAHADTFINII